VDDAVAFPAAVSARADDDGCWHSAEALAHPVRHVRSCGTSGAMQCAAHDWNSAKHASSVEGVAVAVAVASVSASSARTAIIIGRNMAYCVPREFRSVNGGRSGVCGNNWPLSPGETA
jgi:hypothetical protein